MGERHCSTKKGACGGPSQGGSQEQTDRARTVCSVCVVMMEQAIELSAATVILVLDPETVCGDAGFGAGQGDAAVTGTNL